MAIVNGVGNSLDGQTGTGAFVGATSPVLVTPNIGTPSALIITNATGDKIGSTDASSAAAGHQGEYISSSILIGSQVSLTSSSTAPITSISLTAGDWDVRGVVVFNPNAATTATSLTAGISFNSTIFGAFGDENNINKLSIPFAAGQFAYLNVGTMRIPLGSTTTIYLIAQAVFAVNTMSAYGFIGARRFR